MVSIRLCTHDVNTVPLQAIFTLYLRSLYTLSLPRIYIVYTPCLYFVPTAPIQASEARLIPWDWRADSARLWRSTNAPKLPESG